MQSRLFDYRISRKLASRITSSLKKQGAAGLIEEALAAASGVETLPETHLFQGGSIPPRTWMLPTLRGEPDALVQAYEAFAEQPLGAVKRPGKVAEQLLLAECAGPVHRTLNLGTDCKAWFTPAVRLVALAQSYPDAEVHADLESQVFTAFIAGATLEVTLSGAYSNFQGKVLEAAVPPSDAHMAAMHLPELVTQDKALVALHRIFRGNLDMQRAVRGLAACIESGATSSVEVRSWLRQAAEVKVSRRAPAGKTLAQAREEAVARALAVMAAGGDGMMRQLYQAVVPLLFSAREFVRSFGSTSHTTRRVRDTTLDEWATRIRSRADSLT